MVGQTKVGRVWFSVSAVPTVTMIVTFPPASHVPVIAGLGVVVIDGTTTVMKVDLSTTPHDATAFAVLPTVSVILACPQNGPSGIGSVGIEYVPVVGQVNGVRVWFSVFVVPVVIEIVTVPPASHVPVTVVVGVVTTGGTVTVM